MKLLTRVLLGFLIFSTTSYQISYAMMEENQGNTTTYNTFPDITLSPKNISSFPEGWWWKRGFEVARVDTIINDQQAVELSRKINRVHLTLAQHEQWVYKQINHGELLGINEALAAVGFIVSKTSENQGVEFSYISFPLSEGMIPSSPLIFLSGRAGEVSLTQYQYPVSPCTLKGPIPNETMLYFLQDRFGTSISEESLSIIDKEFLKEYQKNLEKASQPDHAIVTDRMLIEGLEGIQAKRISPQNLSLIKEKVKDLVEALEDPLSRLYFNALEIRVDKILNKMSKKKIKEHNINQEHSINIEDKIFSIDNIEKIIQFIEGLKNTDWVSNNPELSSKDVQQINVFFNALMQNLNKHKNDIEKAYGNRYLDAAVGHSEQNIIYYINDQGNDFEKRILDKIEGILPHYKIHGMVFHIHSRLDICEGCAPVIARELEMVRNNDQRSVLTRIIQKISKAQGFNIQPSFNILCSSRHDTKNSANESGVRRLFNFDEETIGNPINLLDNHPNYFIKLMDFFYPIQTPSLEGYITGDIPVLLNPNNL